MTFKWFNRKAEAEEPVVDTRIDARDHEFVRERQGTPMIPLKLAGLQKVPKWCHPGRGGKLIICPECGGDARVYHFSWKAVQCQHCGADVEKHDWYLAASTEEED